MLEEFLINSTFFFQQQIWKVSVVSFNSAIRIPVRKADGIKNVQDAPGVSFLGVAGGAMAHTDFGR